MMRFEHNNETNMETNKEVVLKALKGAFIERDPKGHQANMAELVRWADEGKISAHVHATYPLAQTADALKVLAGRQAMGKVILHP